MEKKWVKSLAALAMVLMAVTIVHELQIMNPVPQVMRVSADGKVLVVPDIAIVRIGVATEGANLIDVKNQNNQKMKQVIAFIKDQKIDSDDIQTTQFYVSPKYNYANGQNNIVGYSANQTVTVKVKEVDQSRATLETIIGNAPAHGANTIQGVSFDFADPEAHKNAARKLAIQNAMEKAKQIADDAHLRLGPVINVIESGGDMNGPMPRVMMAMSASEAKSVEPNVELGTEDVTQNISLLFEVFKK